MKRPYTKHDTAYWENRKNLAPAASPVTVQNFTSPQQQITPVPFPDVAYGSADDGVATPSVRGRLNNTQAVDEGAFQNLKSIALPYYAYNGNRNYVGVSDAVDLCARAWAGVSSCRNAIEVSVEFSSQPLYLKSDNQSVKTFFREWLHAAQIDKFKQQFFREYYRSGNVFIYKFDGKFGPSYYRNLQTSFGAKANRVPIRYELLNPSNVFVPTGITQPYTYVRLLSTYDLDRLRHPLTDQDKQVFNDLPENVKQQISTTSSFPLGIYIPLDPNRLRYAFYKKQDYEPLAIPMLWPVLPDIEWKLMLKKMDKNLAQSVERIVLLITTGETGTQYNGGNGLNQNNFKRLQQLFSNPALCRTLVADYTTKGQFIQPDLSGLNPEKYKVVNEDIREGLQSILTGDDKFANAQIKAKIFIQRLEEGQEEFLRFLRQEIQMICDTMGFRSAPEIGFVKINLQDEAVMARIITQLLQLGALTADQAVNALENGIMPDANEMLEGQKTYKKQRDDGLYYPLVGGSQKDDGSTGGAASPAGRPSGTKGIKQTTKQVSPIGTSKASMEKAPANSAQFSMKEIVETIKASDILEQNVQKELKKHYKLKGDLTEVQQNIARTLAKTIMATYSRDQWEKKVKESIKEPPLVPEAIASEIEEICDTYQVEEWDAAILRQSKTQK